MKRFFALALTAALLTGCAAQKADARVETLQSRYAAVSGCVARVEETVVRGEETADYTLDIARTPEGTRVTVCEPEPLAGISAIVREDDTLSLEFDGMVLDAGSANPNVSAANAVSVFLRAAAEGYVSERSTERFGDADALRLCFETEHAGKKLLVTSYFDGEDAPLYTEIEQDGRILAYLRFTDFSFCDIITPDS